MSSYGLKLPQPDEHDYHEALAVQRAEQARRGLDPSDVLAELQHVLLEIADDDQHPLFCLVVEATRHGTERESGVMPQAAEFVGAALMPYLDKALSRLVGERLDDWSAWED